MERFLTDQLRRHTGRSPALSEIRSWNKSVPILLGDLISAGLGKVEVLVEYRLPLTSKRADVVLAGVHPRTGEDSYVVVELKQWSDAFPYEDSTELVTVPGVRGGPRQHPASQVEAYCEYLLDFTAALHDTPQAVSGAAYLHNAGQDVALALSGRLPTNYGRLFTGADRGRFAEYLLSRLSTTEGGASAADRLLGSTVEPSRQLLSVAADEIAHREQFVLLDEQAVAYELVLHAVERARAGDTKSVIIVTGGPGSGKSVIALSVMGALAAKGRTVVHATGSRSFTETLRRVTGQKRSKAASLFKYFNSFIAAERNGLDVLILDEAHRIRETSANRWTKAEHRTGRPQLDELISAARTPVFLLDENQVVRPGELGTPRDIRAHAKSLGLGVHEVPLDAQFRCGGSEAYVQWANNLLQLNNGQPYRWVSDGQFQVDVVNSPIELEARLSVARQRGFSARMTAGYCWPWSDPRPDKTLVPDVTIGEWARPWNLKGERAVPGAPPASLWATEPDGFNQIGCVYTAQGFEYDWNGLIFGPDLVWRAGRWVSRREYNKDPDFRSRGRVSDSEFDRLVRNVYKVLLTRGMVGTLLFSTDHETQDFLNSLIRT
ncbi:DNA/RNA helicase domain-containing protein [Nakamurella aerolata]|uniref:DNA/RNA helicase domain-containing protein n=1 Tax=Nakamurella aerolata TaxID=1656892 RepID=UPI001BB1C1E3